jgi:signal transduction histidine kinase
MHASGSLAPAAARGLGRPLLGSPGARLADLGLAAVVVTAITLALYPLSELDPGVSSGVLYVLGVLLLAIYRGLWLGIVTSVASAVASVIADRARQRAEEAEQRLRLEEDLRARDAERIRLREVQASRARVIEAADQERRRVVRDLHDGAQQRLVTTILTLSLARGLLERDETGANALVDEALAHAQLATNELRELAHGILPSALTHGGLRDGVDALASRMPLRVEMDLPATRLPANVEAAAYFVVAEALTNVAKHAAANRAWVTATTSEKRLQLEIRDDGTGGARPDGSGLLGMQDRLAVLDGELRVESPPGGGTLIAATLPMSR